METLPGRGVLLVLVAYQVGIDEDDSTDADEYQDRGDPMCSASNGLGKKKNAPTKQTRMIADSMRSLLPQCWSPRASPCRRDRRTR